MSARIATIVIGRNEGERLIRCLESLRRGAGVDRIIYVDSGSGDGSLDAACALGAEGIALDMSKPFTAARARNAGMAALEDRAATARPEYLQVVDGDCEMHPCWLQVAAAFLDANPDVVMVAGRLRERAPEASLWNRLTDGEWDTATGEVDAVGGIALMRFAPVREVGGYRAALTAGEEPELCLRLRERGWKIWRLPDEMALHDVAMTRFSQWWRRTRRGGRAFAESAALHAERGFRCREVLRALFWGAVLPLAALLGCLVTPWSLLLLLAWPVQVFRLVQMGHSAERALFLTLGKVAEAQGVIAYWRERLDTRKSLEKADS